VALLQFDYDHSLPGVHSKKIKPILGTRDENLAVWYRRNFNICYLSSVSDISKKPRSDFHIFTWDTWFLPV